VARTRGPREVHAAQDDDDTLPVADPTTPAARTVAQDQGARDCCAKNRFHTEKRATDVGHECVQEEMERGFNDQKVLKKHYYYYYMFRHRGGNG
jgi:hypothetical protein